MTFTTVVVWGTLFVSMLIAEISFQGTIESSNFSSFVNSKNQRNNKLFFVFALLISGLRNPNTGTDTAGYFGLYEGMLLSTRTLWEYWNDLIKSIISGNANDSVFWLFFSKLMSGLIKSPQVWIAFISALFLFAVYVTIKRYSKNAILSWVCIFCLFIFSFILQGLRQSLAMMMILFSFKYVKESKLWKFLACMALAYLFHNSSIIFSIVYPLRRAKAKKYYFAITIGSFILFNLFEGFGRIILLRLVSGSRFEYYVNDIASTYSVWGWIILFAIFTFCYFMRNKAKDEDRSMDLLLLLSLLGLVAQSAAGILAEMFRISYYFNMFNMLLIPNVVQSISNQRFRQQYSLLITGVIIAYNIYSGLFAYTFYWQ